nr:hypothetical protein OH837_47830 [Streptomyces canus]
MNVSPRQSLTSQTGSPAVAEDIILPVTEPAADVDQQNSPDLVQGQGVRARTHRYGSGGSPLCQ